MRGVSKCIEAERVVGLQSGAARFPVRPERDLSGYVPDGQHGGIPTQLVIPPGTSDEDRAAIEQAQVRAQAGRGGRPTQRQCRPLPDSYSAEIRVSSMS